MDRTTVSVIGALQRQDVPCVVLKGATFESLLYEPGDVRVQTDIDLLVRPSSITKAEQVLFEHGFHPANRPRDFSAAAAPRTVLSRAHAHPWHRGDGITVDLHTSLLGVRIDPVLAFDVLTRDSTTIHLGWAALPSLSLVGRALHLGLHAAQHQRDSPRTVMELGRAIESLPRTLWRDASSLAAHLGATAAFEFGLRSTPSGSALADELGLPAARDAETVLIADPLCVPGAVALERLLRVRGTRAKLQLLAREMLPPARYMRLIDQRARRGRLGLLIAYGTWLRRVPATVCRAAVTVADAKRELREGQHRT